MSKNEIMQQIDQQLDIVQVGPETFQINMDGEYAHVSRGVMEYIRKLHYRLVMLNQSYQEAEEFGNRYYDLYQSMNQ